jgi:hypothetical protein
MSENEGSAEVETDGFMLGLVRLANDVGLSIELSLQVKGVVVYGKLCSATDYFEELVKNFAGANAVTEREIAAREGLVEGFTEILTKLRSKAETWTPGDIHLRDVTIEGPQGEVRAHLWRGRVSSIDGFIIGKRERD